MKFQILVDSSSDIDFNYLQNDDISFDIIPLTIYIGNEEFVDDKNLNIQDMITKMNACKEKMRSSCPSPESWLEKFNQADYTFVVAMTSKLSGTYNSAVVAQQMAPNKDNIYVFDTKSTSGSMELVVDEIVRLIKENKEFKEIVEKVEEFIKTRHLFFILHRFDNLVANGRMSKFAGFMAKTLVIKPICSASPEGTIDIVHKCIGALNAYKKLAELMQKRCTDFSDRKLIITHCNNLEDAEKIKELVSPKCNFKEIVIKQMHGLTSFYAQEKGLIICF